MYPYEKCNNCPARNFCKVISGEVESFSDECRFNDNVKETLKKCKVPIGYQNANIYEYLVDSENSTIFEEMKVSVKNIVDIVENGTNFLFHGGDVGTGKTYNGCVLLNHYIFNKFWSVRPLQPFESLFCNSNKIAFYESANAMFAVYPDLVDNLRYRRDEKEVQIELQNIRNAQFLLLDDVGAGTITDFVREQTYLILNHRFNNRLATVITSNYSLETLEGDDKLGIRSISRMAARVKGSKFSGRDRRVMN